MDYDLFNGDADGICSLIQLRLAEPRQSLLITGIKRHINLMDQVTPKAGDHITVLDVSMEKNQAGLALALEAGAHVFYADHHRSGEIPDHPSLQAHIHLAPDTCTAVIIDGYLQGRYREWAIVGAYGDNMLRTAEALADLTKPEVLSVSDREQLKTLGVVMNYNGYGSSTDDLYYHPAELYRLANSFESPFDFIQQRPEVYEKLKNGYEADMAQGLTIQPIYESITACMIELPDEPWARRVSGVLGNELANRYPDRAHAILTQKPRESGVEVCYQVSLRASKSNPTGAADIAILFGGGGRESAAGIDHLAQEDIEHLWRALNR